MRLLDLTLTIPDAQRQEPTSRREELRIHCGGAHYTGVIHHFSHNSMAGTYIDFPSHIKETDDGSDAVRYPLEKLYRVDASVIHLNRKSESGEIHSQELKEACPARISGGALVVNALGKLRFDEIARDSVFYAPDAVQWIIETGIHLLVSDVYESSKVSQGVFPRLFGRGITTVCLPINLHRLDQHRFKISALPLKFSAATQLPCRVVAELS